VSRLSRFQPGAELAKGYLSAASKMLAVPPRCNRVCQVGTHRTGFAWLRLAALAAACAVVCGPLAIGTSAARQSESSSQAASFDKLAAQLTSARDNGDPESQSIQDQALAILDAVALQQLNSPSPDLDALNTRLATFVAHQPPVGEGYQVLRLGGAPATYALLANFGPGGPSAIRLYSGAPGHLSLAGHIDRYAQKDFLDDYVELVPIVPTDASQPLFVTVAGRTDDQQTGVFTAWRFDGSRAEVLWMSDILENSSYQSGPDGFVLTYCADADPGDSGACSTMRRDRFVWQGGGWKRVDTATLPPATPRK